MRRLKAVLSKNEFDRAVRYQSSHDEQASAHQVTATFTVQTAVNVYETAEVVPVHARQEVEVSVRQGLVRHIYGGISDRLAEVMSIWGSSMPRDARKHLSSLIDDLQF